MKRKFALVLTAVAFVVGCGDSSGEGGPAEPVVRDSLGVELVENRGTDSQRTAPVRLGETPMLVLGDREGAPGHDLFRARGAVRFSNGDVAVANGSTSEVRFFDSRGSQRRVVGGSGDGPGEFRILGPMALLPGDTLLVFDPGRNALVRFGRDGMLTSNERQEGGPSLSFTEGYVLLRDGARVARGYDPTAVSREVRGPQQTRSPIIIVSADDSRVDTIGTWPGRDLLYLDLVSAPQGRLGSAMPTVRPLFSAESVIAGDAVAGVWVVGDQRRPYFQVRDSEGTLLRHVRWTPESREPTPQDMSDLRDQQLSDSEGSPTAVAQAMEQFPEGTHVPVFRRMVVDRDGRIWVERFPLPSDDVQVWWIFSPDGRWVGNLSLSERIEPLEIGPDYLVSLERDEFDVERIVVWPLEWSES